MPYFTPSFAALLVLLGLVACAVLLAVLAALHRRGDSARIRALAAVVLPLWAIGLAFAVLPAAPLPDPSIPSGTFNWVPFLAHGERDLGAELAANLGLFAPMALVLAFCWRGHTVAKTTLLALGISVGIEATQLLLENNRAADITDVITNTAGGFLAACLGTLLARRSAPKPARDTHPGVRT